MFIFTILTSGILDLGMAVFRYNILANAARQGARRAIVHGQLAPPLTVGVWGPTTIDKYASATGVPIIDGGVRQDGGTPDGLKRLLVGCDLTQTKIKVEWIDNSNADGKRVRVTVSCPYTPLMTLLLKSVTLQASSTMPIAH
jgi:hypothetical protein